MSVGLYSHTTRATGTVLTAAIYNADHVNHITNQNPLMTGAYSDNLTQYQLNSTPGGLGTEDFADNLGEEVERLRFCIKRICGTSQWYVAPPTDLSSIPGSGPLNIAAAATIATFRRTENDTTDREVESFQSGSGAGNKYSFSIVGSGSNAVATTSVKIGSTDIRRQHIDRVKEYLPVDFPENAAPGNPAADHVRLYAKDVSTVSKLAYRDSAGSEFIIQAQGIISPAAEIRTGSATITIPTGATKLKVTLQGAGGGGGGAATSGCCQDTEGGSAGSGATLMKYLSGLTPGNTLSLTIGAAGPGGAAGNNNGTGGGSTSLASGTQSITTLTASGGSAGNGAAANTVGANGTGGGSTNGDANITGDVGRRYTLSVAGVTSGGDSLFGHGGFLQGNGSGVAGTGHGAGGTGGWTGLGGAQRAGGAGTVGLAIFEWYA